MLGKAPAPEPGPGLHYADSNRSFSITFFLTESCFCFLFGQFDFGYLVIAVRELSSRCQPAEVVCDAHRHEATVLRRVMGCELLVLGEFLQKVKRLHEYMLRQCIWPCVRAPLPERMTQGAAKRHK